MRTLQCSLNDVGVGPVVVDGFYGPQTKAAVKEITDGFEGTGARTPTGSTTASGCCSSAASCRDSNLAHRGARPGRQGAPAGAPGRGRHLVVDGSFGAQTETVVKRLPEGAPRPARNGVVDEDTRFFLGMGGVIGQLN